MQNTTSTSHPRWVVWLLTVTAATLFGCGGKPTASPTSPPDVVVQPLDVVDSQPADPEAPFAEQVAAVKRGEGDAIEVTAPVDGEQLAELSGLINLLDLKLENLDCTAEQLAVLATLPSLEHLRLRGVAVDDSVVDHLLAARGLAFLNLPHARLSDAAVARLAALSELELLRLGGLEMTDDGLAEIRKFPSLRFLHLIGAPVTDQGLKHLHGWAQLESLYLDGAKVTDAGMGALLQTCPNLHVHIDQRHHDLDPRGRTHEHANAPTPAP